MGGNPLLESELSSESIDTRLEFIRQCQRRLAMDLDKDPKCWSLTYRLSSLWSLSLDNVRLLHVSALLDTDGGRVIVIIITIEQQL